jgi:hypothetical protein
MRQSFQKDMALEKMVVDGHVLGCLEKVIIDLCAGTQARFNVQLNSFIHWMHVFALIGGAKPSFFIFLWIHFHRHTQKKNLDPAQFWDPLP